MKNTVLEANNPVLEINKLDLEVNKLVLQDNKLPLPLEDNKPKAKRFQKMKKLKVVKGNNKVAPNKLEDALQEELAVMVAVEETTVT